MEFDIVVMTFNEAENIPQLANSLTDYMKAGGKVFLFDTGSTDDTVKIGRELGFNVTISNKSFHKTLNKSLLAKWRQQFKMSSFPVQPPANFFCFDLARNEAEKITEKDCIFFADGCDYFITLDYDTINKEIKNGVTHFQTTQLYGFTKGNIKRFYNKKISFWKGHVHEYLETPENTIWKVLEENVFSIRHKTVEKDRKTSYMSGLIVTHMLNPDISRWYYYVARELMNNNYYADAKRLFQKRADFMDTPEECAASLCKIANILSLEKADEEIIYSYYIKASNVENSTLREPHYEVCEYNFKKKNWKIVLSSAEKVLDYIKNTPTSFFEEERFDKELNVYWYLFHGHWYAGKKEMAIYYWKKFANSRNIIEEKHPWYKKMQKYKNFPMIPHVISEKKLTKTIANANEITNYYKFISDIECENKDMNPSCSIFLNIICRYTKPMTNCIDINSGVGELSIALSKIMHPYLIYSFETDKFKELTTNAYLNGSSNIKSYEINIENHDDFLELASYNVESRKLDSFNFQNIGLIIVNKSTKSQQNVIMSGMKTIIQYSPVIMIEYNHSFEKDCEKVDSVLLSLEYTKLKLKTSVFYIPKINMTKKKVAIVCNFIKTWDKQNYEDKDYTFIGETERACLNLATALSNKEVEVDLWCTPSVKYTFGDNPRYLNYRNFHNYIENSDYYDAVVWCRGGDDIKVKHQKTKNILWLQDYSLWHNPEKVNPLLSKVVFLSQNHKETMLKNDDIKSLENISVVIPNSSLRLEYQEAKCIFTSDDVTKYEPSPSIATYMSSGRFKSQEEILNEEKTMNWIKNWCINSKIKSRCIYTNNHAYGLAIILNEWELIKAKIPDASLRILYGYETWGAVPAEFTKVVKDKIKELKDRNLDVKIYENTLNEKKMQEKMQKADFWLYPGLYEDPFCIQGIQAVHAGCIPIVSDQKYLRILAPDNCVVWPLTDNNFSNKCIEIMSLDNDQLDSIREETVKRGKELFVDFDKCYDMFSKVLF